MPSHRGSLLARIHDQIRPGRGLRMIGDTPNKAGDLRIVPRDAREEYLLFSQSRVKLTQAHAHVSNPRAAAYLNEAKVVPRGNGQDARPFVRNLAKARRLTLNESRPWLRGVDVVLITTHDRSDKDEHRDHTEHVVTAIAHEPCATNQRVVRPAVGRAVHRPPCQLRARRLENQKF